MPRLVLDSTGRGIVLFLRGTEIRESAHGSETEIRTRVPVWWPVEVQIWVFCAFASWRRGRGRGYKQAAAGRGHLSLLSFLWRSGRIAPWPAPPGPTLPGTGPQ